MASRVHSDSREIVLCSAVAEVQQAAAGSPGDREAGRGETGRGRGGRKSRVGEFYRLVYTVIMVIIIMILPYKYIEFSGCVGMLY